MTNPIAVDELAQFIRTVDGNHDLGAGALAEKIIEAGYIQLTGPERVTLSLLARVSGEDQAAKGRRREARTRQLLAMRLEGDVSCGHTEHATRDGVVIGRYFIGLNDRNGSWEPCSEGTVTS